MIRTYTGLTVNPLALRPEDVNLHDIAHALAQVNRFAGHLKFPISVAQHSVWAARLCLPFGPDVALQALLHDASEAYLGDVTKWLKATPEFAAYREAEARAQALIFTEFGCSTEMHQAVEAADRVLVRFEGRQGFGDDWVINHNDYPPLTQSQLDLFKEWVPETWATAELEFNNYYWFLAREFAR